MCELSNVAPGPAGYGVGFWAETDSAEACWYSLVGIRDSGSIDLIVTGSVDAETGNTFQYATMQSASDPYERLIAVATGYLGESQGGLTDLSPEFSYYFAYFQPTLEIIEPNARYLAHVGRLRRPRSVRHQAQGDELRLPRFGVGQGSRARPVHRVRGERCRSGRRSGGDRGRRRVRRVLAHRAGSREVGRSGRSPAPDSAPGDGIRRRGDGGHLRLPRGGPDGRHRPFREHEHDLGRHLTHRSRTRCRPALRGGLGKRRPDRHRPVQRRRRRARRDRLRRRRSDLPIVEHGHPVRA